MTATEQLPQLPPPRRTDRWVYILLAAVAALVLAMLWLFHAVTDSRNHADRAEDHAAAASSAAAANQAGLEQANRQLERLGGTPVPTPAPVTQAPTDQQIDLAVEDYCAARNGCTGTPSEAEVAAAVKAFCAAGACRGPRGSSGAPGAAGPSGAPGAAGASGARGEAGPGPTDDQVGAAVAAYCAAHGDCTGPAGPKGDTGATGPAGRGIASIDCTGLGVDKLVVHYDDGTDQTVDCNPPSPTPTPSGAPAS